MFPTVQPMEDLMRKLSSLFLFALALSVGCASGESAKKDEAAVVDATAPATVTWPNVQQASDTLYVGGQPDADSLASAKAAGVTTVINLRAADEMGYWQDEQAEVEKLGMRYVSIVVNKPTADPAALTKPQAEALAAALGEAEGKAVLHCASGNRAGGLLAVKSALVDGMSTDDAIALGKKAGMSPALEALVRERIEAASAGE